MDATTSVRRDGELLWITIEREAARNAVDRATAQGIADALRGFDADPALRVAILAGRGASFCAGADLKAVASGDPARMNRLEAGGDGPMGPTRMQLAKPVIAAISGWCVAGGLELALWCDLRVADDSAQFGVFCRRFGVPLIDGGTVRLPRAIGMSRALDMILTGRAVDAREAYDWGLVNRLVPAGTHLEAAGALAREIAALPQRCLRNDRRSAYAQWGQDESAALAGEFRLGLDSLAGGEAASGAQRFGAGAGRHGAPGAG